ncbi:MAG: hypothetical protein ACOC33_03955 [bacterium]
MKNSIVLEPSTNTHTLNGNIIESEKISNSVIDLKIKGDGVVLHGEHGTIRTESNFITKYTQKEMHPISKKLMNAFD